LLLHFPHNDITYSEYYNIIYILNNRGNDTPHQIAFKIGGLSSVVALLAANDDDDDANTTQPLFAHDKLSKGRLLRIPPRMLEVSLKY
jgi:hypothetical protein